MDHKARRNFHKGRILRFFEGSPAQDEGYRWRVLAIATFAQTAGSFLVQGLGALGAFLQAAFGLDAYQVGLLASAAQFAPILGLLAAGALLDHFNERLVIGAGALMVGASLAAASQAQSYGGLLFWLILVSAGYSVVQPGGGKAVASWFPAHQRGLAMGIRQAGLPLSAALATAILPSVAIRVGWRAAFVLGALAAFAGGAAFAALYQSPAESDKTSRAGPSPSLREEIAARLALLKRPGVARIVWSGVTLVTAQFALSMYLPLDLRDRFHMPIEIAVRLLFLAQGAGVVGRIALAYWSDRFAMGRYFFIAISFLAMAAGLTAFALAPAASPYATLAALSLWLGFFGFGWYGPWIALVSETAPPGRIGFMIGLAMSINQIAVVIGPPAAGLARDVVGTYAYGWVFMAAALIIAWTRTRRV